MAILAHRRQRTGYNLHLWLHSPRLPTEHRYGDAARCFGRTDERPRRGFKASNFDHGSWHAVATVVVDSLEAFMSPPVQRYCKSAKKLNRRESSFVPFRLSQ